MLPPIEMAARLGLATLIGALVGLNRDLHDKPAGLRTHALMALGAALAIVVAEMLAVSGGNTADAVSRVTQGLVAGVGFIGGGLILRAPDQHRVHGLTTAAGLWATAVFGAACGAGAFVPVGIAFGLLSLVLMLGGGVEKFVHERLRPPAPP